MGQHQIDFAHMIAGDRLPRSCREVTGIDGLLDAVHDRTNLSRADPHHDGRARRQWLVMQPEQPGPKAPDAGRGGLRVSNDIAALNEQFAVERNPDGMPRRDGFARRTHRPAFDRLDLRLLSRRHDNDIVTHGEMPGFDPTGDDAPVVEFVDRLHRQAKRPIIQPAK